MLRLIAYTLLFALLGLAGMWLSLHPGRFTLTWLGWRVDASASALPAIFALLVGLAMLLFAVLRLPRRIRAHQRHQHAAKGLGALTQSMVALAAGDMRGAKLQLKDAQKFLGPAPITLLLAAQMARLEGDETETRGLLEAMLGHRETRRIAAKGLSEYHERRGQAAQALPHAKMAAGDDPRDSKALSTLVGAHARLGQWQEAERALKRVAWIVPRKERHRLLAHIYCARARDLKAAGQYMTAFSFMRSAVKLMPDSAPMAALAAEMAPGDQRVAIASKIIRNAWRKQPHAVLADALLSVMDYARPADLLKTARKVAATNPEHEESHLLLARAEMHAKEWDEARRSLKDALSERESARACRMMADIEEAQYHDAEATARWRLRASDAEPDPEWVCDLCATTSPAWEPHCPGCHAMGSMEWKRRSLRYAEAAA